MRSWISFSFFLLIVCALSSFSLFIKCAHIRERIKKSYSFRTSLSLSFQIRADHQFPQQIKKRRKREIDGLLFNEKKGKAFIISLWCVSFLGSSVGTYNKEKRTAVPTLMMSPERKKTLSNDNECDYEDVILLLLFHHIGLYLMKEKIWWRMTNVLIITFMCLAIIKFQSHGRALIKKEKEVSARPIETLMMRHMKDFLTS